MIPAMNAPHDKGTIHWLHSHNNHTDRPIFTNSPTSSTTGTTWEALALIRIANKAFGITIEPPPATSERACIGPHTSKTKTPESNVMTA